MYLYCSALLAPSHRVGWVEQRGWARIALHSRRAWFETRSGFAEALLTMR